MASRPTLVDAFTSVPVFLTEGGVIESLRRDADVHLDPHILNAALLYDTVGRERLAAIYREYLEIGRTRALPMLVGAPTWRANPERCERAGRAAEDVNADAIRFMRNLPAGCGPYAEGVYVGGLLGPRGDAYRPADSLSADAAVNFHTPQAHALAAAGADFLLAATLPAYAEALGLARALAATGVPYFLSFVLRPTGTCLDDTPLVEVIERIDQAVTPPPLAYCANCVHPTVFRAALESISPAARVRIRGLQANTSRCSPEQLDGRADLDSEAPAPFAAAMLDVHRRFDTRILGGCCGTDQRHIGALAAALVHGESKSEQNGLK